MPFTAQTAPQMQYAGNPDKLTGVRKPPNNTSAAFALRRGIPNLVELSRREHDKLIKGNGDEPATTRRQRSVCEKVRRSLAYSQPLSAADFWAKAEAVLELYCGIEGVEEDICSETFAGVDTLVLSVFRDLMKMKPAIERGQQ